MLVKDAADTYDSSYLTDFGLMGHQNVKWQEGKVRFPSPKLSNGPGEYANAADYEDAKKAVYWARGQYMNLDSKTRFPTPKLGTGPGEFASEAELEKAKKAIMWSRLQGQAGDASKERLTFLLKQGADKEYDGAALSDFGGRRGKDLTWAELKERFPSPVLGHGPGEYRTVEEYEAARKAVLWAREQAHSLDKGQRFPTPKLGTGPGEYASEAELEAAKQAIMWSRLRGQVGDAEKDRLTFLSATGADTVYDSSLLSTFGAGAGSSSRVVDVKQRVPRPVFATGPGDSRTLSCIVVTSCEPEAIKR